MHIESIWELHCRWKHTRILSPGRLNFFEVKYTYGFESKTLLFLISSLTEGKHLFNELTTLLSPLATSTQLAQLFTAHRTDSKKPAS